MKSVILIFLAAGALGCAVSSGRPGQGTFGVKATNNSSYPLQIVSISPQVSEDGTAFQGARVTLQNTAEVPCNAFAVSFIITFSDGETRRATWQEDHVALGYTTQVPATDNRIMQKQSYNGDATGMGVSTPESAAVTGIEARLDYIEMADGKRYGDDPDKVSEAFRMARWGASSERKRLLNVYKSGGTQALVEQLEQK